MLEKIRNNLFLILIITVALLLSITNYAPGTFLSGWDTLHPEFNFGLSISREINGVFRTEQGLGAVAAHSHMADLPHVFILYLLHFILPLSDLRYFYIFLNLILGPIGMYFFLNKYIVKNKIWSFLGSLFYLLNLGTMQIFVVPFEMFTTQYAALPWLFLFATDYLLIKEKPTKNLLLFLIATFFTAPSAYAATLWYVYFFVLILYIFSLSFLERSLLTLKKSLLIIALTLLINAFWIFPNIYYVFTHANQVPNALINQLFSPQAFLYNKEFGNIRDIALLKNFLFDWNAYSGNGTFSPLLSSWIINLNQKSILLIGSIFVLVSLGGVFYGTFKKNKILASLIPPLLLCIFFLINDNPPTSFLYNFFQNKIPFFKEAFRFPDDKVLGIFTFLFAIYFAKGQEFIQKLRNKILNYKLRKAKDAMQALIFFLLIMVYMLPAFKGYFISPYMRINIPKSYFEMFNWFKNQDTTARVANFPIQSVWGWEYYNWYPSTGSGQASFQGADFLQFGIPQPLLNRDFDRWNPANEQYYREMSEAIYSQDSTKLINVLKKYDISYVLLDKSIIAPEQGMNPQILFLKETENLLKNTIDIQQVFNSGNLFIYQVSIHNQKVRIIKNPVSVGPAFSAAYDDFVYTKYNDYVTYSNLNKNTVLYPFRNIINNENLVSPSLSFPFFPTIEKQYAVVLSDNPYNDCSLSNPANSESKMKLLENNSGKFLRYSSTSSPLCNHYSFPDARREQGYLISIVSRNITGLPLKLCVQNYISKRCDLFTQLSASPNFTEETFLLPPMEKGVGFDINFNNFTINKSPAINDLSSVKIIPFPYAEILQTEQYRPNNFKNVSFISYSQSFDSGWKAYEIKLEAQNSKLKTFLVNMFPFLFGKELKNHVLVNNWANGWELNNSDSKSSKIVIIFWPQYLEYLGFGILLATFVWVILFTKKN